MVSPFRFCRKVLHSQGFFYALHPPKLKASFKQSMQGWYEFQVNKTGGQDARLFQLVDKVLFAVR